MNVRHFISASLHAAKRRDFGTRVRCCLLKQTVKVAFLLFMVIAYILRRTAFSKPFAPLLVLQLMLGTASAANEAPLISALLSPALPASPPLPPVPPLPPISPGWSLSTAKDLKLAVEVLTPQSPPSAFMLSERHDFLLGDFMNGDGTGFLRLDGPSVTLVGMGRGATLDAQRRGRMFYVTAGNLTLTNLRLLNGSAQATPCPI